MSTDGDLTTACQLFEMGSDAPYELNKGKLVKTHFGTLEHGRVAANLAMLLNHHAKQTDLGLVTLPNVGYVLEANPDTVRGPDVSLLAESKIPRGSEKEGFVYNIPELVAEVIDPNDRAEEIDEKVQDFLRAGVRLIWVIHPKTKTVTEYRSLDQMKTLTESDRLDGYDVIPGLSLPVSELFS